MKSFFSVVISVYNKAEYIQKTISSVLNQSFEDFELIVINDGSTDTSEQLINIFKDKRLRLITTQNQGASNARNTGIREASSNYIALLDGDDLWDTDYLKTIHEAIIKYPKIKVFASALAQKYKSKVIPVNYNFTQESLFEVHDYFKSSLKYSLLSSSSIVFNKAILSEIGDFDASIASGQDTDLWIRIGLNFEIVFANKILAFYRHVPNSLSNTTASPERKPKFDKFLDEEKDNIYLKKFIDRNRYAMAILSKLNNNDEYSSYYISNLNTKNISLIQLILLKSPKWLLVLLLKIKSLKGEKTYYPLN